VNIIAAVSDPGFLRAEDTFLMVIDLQEPLMRVVWDRDRVVTNTSILMEAAQALGLPMIVTAQNRDRLGDLIPEVLGRIPAGAEVLNKMTFSCMRDERIAGAVASLGRSQALLCGVETHVCVHQTAHDLLAMGYKPHVASDAVSSRKQSNWVVALSRMERAGITVTSTEMALYEIMERAGTPEFRKVLPLVR
jgi:nicotinamidase-related amidase